MKRNAMFVSILYHRYSWETSKFPCQQMVQKDAQCNFHLDKLENDRERIKCGIEIPVAFIHFYNPVQCCIAASCFTQRPKQMLLQSAEQEREREKSPTKNTPHCIKSNFSVFGAEAINVLVFFLVVVPTRCPKRRE